MAAALAMLGVAAPARADGSAVDIAKSIDKSLQGAGFTAPSTFLVGSTVNYTVHVSCSSLTVDCVTGSVADVLDPRLQPVSITKPTTSLPITTSISGQTMSASIGSAGNPWKGGNSMDFVFTAKVVGSGNIPNTATVSGPDSSMTSIQQDITVPTPTPNWSLQKAGGGSIALGENAAFSIYFRVPAPPLGNVAITGGTLVDTFPAGAVVLNRNTLAPIPDGGTLPDGGKVDYTSHTITWTVPKLDPTFNAGQCDSTSCVSMSWYPEGLLMNFPADKFSVGQTVTNNVTSTVSYGDGTSGTLNG